MSPSVLRVLVVDDNPFIADSTAMLIQALGHDSRSVHRGAEAVSIVPVYLPHVALIDIEMSGMDGWETARRIRQLPDGEGIVLAALTGHGRPQDYKKSQEAGFDHHFIKPFNGEELGSYLEAVARPLR